VPAAVLDEPKSWSLSPTESRPNAYAVHPLKLVRQPFLWPMGNPTTTSRSM
jgi:hypothetical protein